MNNKYVQDFANKTRPILIKLELSIFILFITGYLLRNSGYGNTVIIFTLGGLSILYYITAFAKISSTNVIAVFLNKLTFMSLSVGVIGILFTIQHYPFASIMLLVGFLSTVVSFFGLIILKIRKIKTDTYVNSDIIRTLMFAIIFIVSMNFANKIIIHGLNDEESIENSELIKAKKTTVYNIGS